MKRYVIERNVPGAGRLSASELETMSRRSCDVLRGLGADIRWIESYVTDDRLYCIYSASDEGAIRTHAERGGFPVDRVSEVRSVIGPATGGAGDRG